MILTATEEIEDILLRYLPLDIVEKIMNMRNSMIASVGVIDPVKGKIIAPKVNMLTPGIAPKNIPPSKPPIKTMILVKLLNKVRVPSMNCSIL